MLVLVGVVVLVFFLFQGFGDPTRIVAGQSSDSTTQANIRRELYLTNENGEKIPKFKQFLYYLNDVSPICFHSKEEITNKKLKGFFIGGDKKFGFKIPYLRKSYQTKRPVWNILMQALPGTLMLAISAMFIAMLIGIPLGVMAAVKQNTWLDTSAIFSSIVGISAPSFFMGIIMVYVFGFVLSDWTGLHIAGSWFAIDDEGHRRLTMQNLILPAITLGIRPMAIITQLTRSGCTRPGLYPHCLCQRFKQKTSHLETWIKKCTEPGYHSHHRLVCRTISWCILCRIYFWLAGHWKSNGGCIGKIRLPGGYGSRISICNFLYTDKYFSGYFIRGGRSQGEG